MPSGKEFISMEKDQPELNFAWSFKSIFIWMRVWMGIELDQRADLHQNHGRLCWSRVLSSFSFLILVVSMSINILALIFTFQDVNVENFRKMGINITQANILIILITGVNDSIYNVTIHFVFYAFILMGKWKSLWSILQAIQCQLPLLNKNFFKRCKKLAIAATICNLVVSFHTNFVFVLKIIKFF